MAQFPKSLAEIHRRVDGPIEPTIRDRALLGPQQQQKPQPTPRLNKDLERLSLSAVRALCKEREQAAVSTRGWSISHPLIVGISRSLTRYRNFAVERLPPGT